MDDINDGLNNNLNHTLNNSWKAVRIERTLAELRFGRPVLIHDKNNPSTVLMVHNSESLQDLIAAHPEEQCPLHAKLVLSPARLDYLGFPQQKQSGVIALANKKYREIPYFVDQKHASPLPRSVQSEFTLASPLEEAALALSHIAWLLPAVIVSPAPPSHELLGHSLYAVTTEDILSYRDYIKDNIRILSRAPVPLAGNIATEFIIFRGGGSLQDHAAIIVGNIDYQQPVLVRLHSSCLTGDLFDSVKCDCGAQLRYALHFMHTNGGGILMYLNQEGRGNGLANKIRAYSLQEDGLDTYDADHALGFDQDSRQFDFAGAMLKKLGVNSIRLLTNNPFKIDSLLHSGLKVVATERVLAGSTQANKQYLISKRDRGGHYITLDDTIDETIDETISTKNS